MTAEFLRKLVAKLPKGTKAKDIAKYKDKG